MQKVLPSGECIRRDCSRICSSGRHFLIRNTSVLLDLTSVLKKVTFASLIPLPKISGFKL